MAALRQIKFRRQYSQLFAMVSFLFLFSACNGNDTGNSISDTEPGALSFRPAFHDTEGNLQRHAAVTDCVGLGIATVEAMVYDQDNVFLVGAGPWDCDTGQGSIPAVPAGSDRIVAILAKDGDGNLIYRGQKTGIDVAAGGQSSAGTIGCDPFVPGLRAPADGLVIPVDTVELAWNAVEGASEYHISVSENDDLSDSLIDDTTQNLYYPTLDVIAGKTYYWQVVAGDVHGNMGVGSLIWSFGSDITSNLLLDPTFSKTTSNTDTNYWDWGQGMEWGAAYGYDLSPGIRITIDGNEKLIAESDGNGQLMKHSVRAGDRLWIRCRVRQSKGADGTFRVGIQEWDRDDNALRRTITDVTTIGDDETWELVTASVTVYDADAALCNLLIVPYGGTTGYFYIDDVVMSRHEPAPIDNAVNIVSDPTFSKTISNSDTQHWYGTPAMEWGAAYGYNSTPGVRCAIGEQPNWLGEMDANGRGMRHPTKVGDRFWIQCRVKRSAGADGTLRIGIQEFDRDQNVIAPTMTNASTFAADETWELVTASITVDDANAAFCRLLIASNGGTTGYFYIDDAFFSRHEQVAIDSASNMVSDPTFSKTTSNNDFEHWSFPGVAIEWGSAYGYNSSPGIRFIVTGNENALIELDGTASISKHPVQAGDRLWIQCRVKRSAGVDGTLKVVISEYDKDYTFLRNTTADVYTGATDDVWEAVTAPITVSDPEAVFCNLELQSYGGTTGYFYIDDVVLSRHEPYE